jgi:hypothetical protein
MGRCGEIGAVSEDIAVLIIAVSGGGGLLAREEGAKHVIICAGGMSSRMGVYVGYLWPF